MLPITPISIPTVATPATTPATGTSGAGFGDALLDSLGQLEQTQRSADQASRMAATGQQTSVETQMVALTEAQIATQLTVAVRNRAIEAFNEIMRMQI